MKTIKEKALEIAQLMEDYKGEDVTVIDVSQLNSWTDYFIIVTINSSTHWKGLYKYVKDYVKADDVLEIHVPNRKTPDGDDWNLIDIGPIVVHLMSKEAREFYDLEKLWHGGEVLRQIKCCCRWCNFGCCGVCIGGVAMQFCRLKKAAVYAACVPVKN